MKEDVGELVRAADPLRHEGIWSWDDKLAVERHVLAVSPAPSSEWSRRSVVTSVAAVLLGLVTGVAVNPRFFSSAVHAAVGFEMRLAELSPGPSLEPVTVPSTGQTIYLHQGAVVRNEDIADARVVPLSNPATFGIEITFTSRGAEKMSRATRSHLGKLVAIIIDGQIVSVPVLRSPISKSAVIDGPSTRTEAERIARGVIGQ
jgi:hypothetical protein